MNFPQADPFFLAVKSKWIMFLSTLQSSSCSETFTEDVFLSRMVLVILNYYLHLFYFLLSETLKMFEAVCICSFSDGTN